MPAQVPPSQSFLPPAASPSTTVFAFVGGLLAVCLSLGLTALSPVKEHSSIVLAGIAVHSLAQTFLMVLKLMADPEKQLASIEYWIMGSLAGVTASKIPFPVVIILFSSAVIFLLHRHILALSVQEDEARMLGVSVQKTRFFVLFLATLTVAPQSASRGLSVLSVFSPAHGETSHRHNRQVILSFERDHRKCPAAHCGRIGEVPDCGGIACEYLHIASRCTVFDLSDSLEKEELSQNG